MSRSDAVSDAPFSGVRVRLFAALRDAAGWSERLVALPPSGDPRPCTPLLLWHELALATHWPVPASPDRPSLSSVPSFLGPSPSGAEPAPLAPSRAEPSLPTGLRVAINQRFATPHTPLNPGDELAFLPPITGG
jgi:molybdopterin synthase sulfur carrier subunit